MDIIKYVDILYDIPVKCLEDYGNEDTYFYSSNVKQTPRAHTFDTNTWPYLRPEETGRQILLGDCSLGEPFKVRLFPHVSCSPFSAVRTQ